MIEREYGKYSVTAESGYDITLEVSLDDLPEDVGKRERGTCLYMLHVVVCFMFTESLATHFALLKRNCFASVFEKYFDIQAKGGEKSTAIIHYREQETM